MFVTLQIRWLDDTMSSYDHIPEDVAESLVQTLLALGAREVWVDGREWCENDYPSSPQGFFLKK